MSVAYISVSQVKERMRASYDGSQDSVLADMIVSCSAFLDVYTNRANGGFAVQTYDELYSGSGSNILFLNNTPIQSITKIASVQLPCVMIQNTDSDNGVRATAQIIGIAGNPINLNSQYTSTGLTLTYVKNAATTTNTLLWTNYPTVSALVNAINSVGSHWSATVQGGFGSWSCSDLRATQGAFGTRVVTAYLWLHWLDLPVFRVNEVTSEIYSQMGFARGWGNYRVIYSAGYTVFPDDLVQCLSELVVNCYYATELNSNLQSQSIGPSSYSQYATKGFDGLSIMAKQTLNRYKIRKVGHYSQW